jgi:hypothetical protein
MPIGFDKKHLIPIGRFEQQGNDYHNHSNRKLNTWYDTTYTLLHLYFASGFEISRDQINISFKILFCLSIDSPNHYEDLNCILITLFRVRLTFSHVAQISYIYICIFMWIKQENILRGYTFVRRVKQQVFYVWRN